MSENCKDIFQNDKLDNYEKALLYDIRYSSGDRNSILSEALFFYRTRKNMVARSGGTSMHQINKYSGPDFEFSPEMKAFLKEKSLNINIKDAIPVTIEK